MAKFNIDQSIQLAADQFEVDLNTSEVFRNRGGLSTVDLSAGLLDVNDDPQLVKHITGGTIDEVELEVGIDRMVTRVRGRDAIAAALDTAIRIVYGVPAGQERTEPVNLPPSLRPIEGVTETIEKTGKWKASMIARDLAQRIGLDCAYLAPDYQLREPFAVTGTVLSAIQQLVAPFSHFEPSRVDIWVDGKTLVIRPRPGLAESPLAGSLPVGPINALHVYDARILNLLIRSRRLDYVRVLRLTGRTTGPCGGAAGGLVRLITQIENKDETGKVISRVVEAVTQRQFDSAILSSEKETYADVDGDFRLVGIERMSAGWDGILFDEDCNVLNSPKQHSQIIRTLALDEDFIMREVSRVKISFAYDATGFMIGQTTEREAFNADENRWEPESKEVRIIRKNGALLYEEVTDRYAAGGESGDEWFHEERRVSPAGGHQPGGGGRIQPRNIGAGDPAYVAILIDNEPGAKDFSLDNPSLEQSHLDTIAQQARDASGAEEVEVSITAVNIPWLRRGQMLRLTGLFAEDGVTPIPLKDFMVVENRTEYDESNPQAKYLSSVKAVYWTKE